MKVTARSDAAAIGANISLAPASTAMRTCSRPSMPVSAARTWASKGLPPIGTRHLCVTRASAASGSSLPSRWAARMMTLKGLAIEQAVAAQPLIKNGLDKLRLGQASADRGPAEHLLRPEIGLKIDLEEVAGAGLDIEPELEASIIERTEFLGDLQRHLGDPGQPDFIVERHELIFVPALDQVALLVIGPQMGGIRLLEQHHGHHHRLAVHGDDRDFDVAAVQERLDD